MKKILEKLQEARKIIASTKMVKKGKNTYSNYTYFEPEQIKILVDDACFKTNIITLMTFENERIIMDVIDIDSEEKLTFSIIYVIPEITATNKMQQIGGLITYSERYLKMMIFGIVDNSLDYDTTEQSHNQRNNQTPTIWATKEEFEKLMSIDDIERLKKGLEYYTTSPRAMKKEWKQQIIEKIKNL